MSAVPATGQDGVDGSHVSAPAREELPERRRAMWTCPLPRLDGASPGVIGHGVAADAEVVHLGYPERSSSSDYVPVFAARDGVISYAGQGNGGGAVCIAHRGGWSSHYGELGLVLVASTDRSGPRRRARVRGGDVIGHACRSSLLIRFGLSRVVQQVSCVVDPRELVRTWSVIPWFVDADMGAATRRVARASCRQRRVWPGSSPRVRDPLPTLRSKPRGHVDRTIHATILPRSR